MAVNREFPQGEGIGLKLVNDNGSEPPVNIGTRYGASGDREIVLPMITPKVMCK